MNPAPRNRGGLAHLLLHERRRAGHAVLLQDAQDGAPRRGEQRAGDARGGGGDRARVLAAQLLDQLRKLRAQLRPGAAARQHLRARARRYAPACRGNQGLADVTYTCRGNQGLADVTYTCRGNQGLIDVIDTA